jgi:hypothetical protein
MALRRLCRHGAEGEIGVAMTGVCRASCSGGGTDKMGIWKNFSRQSWEIRKTARSVPRQLKRA